MDPMAKDLVTKLLVSDPTKRIGCLKTGSRGVQKHGFFKGYDFVALKKRQATAPYLPNVKGPDDTSMFVKYTNRVSTGGEHISEEEQKMFRRFSSHGNEGTTVPQTQTPELKKRMYPPPKASLATNAPEIAEVSF